MAKPVISALKDKDDKPLSKDTKLKVNSHFNVEGTYLERAEASEEQSYGTIDDSPGVIVKFTFKTEPQAMNTKLKVTIKSITFTSKDESKTKPPRGDSEGGITIILYNGTDYSLAYPSPVTYTD